MTHFCVLYICMVCILRVVCVDRALANLTNPLESLRAELLSHCCGHYRDHYFNQIFPQNAIS